MKIGRLEIVLGPVGPVTRIPRRAKVYIASLCIALCACLFQLHANSLVLQRQVDLLRWCQAAITASDPGIWKAQ